METNRNTKQEFGSLRLKPETLEKLRDVKLAFETSYLVRVTNDDLIRKLIGCIEDAEPAVWENLCLIREKKEKEG